jgi:hypothetical protein
MIFTEQPIYARAYIFTHVLWKFLNRMYILNGLRIKELLIPIFWKQLRNERKISFYYFKNL